jgi:O-antigen ligase
MNVIIILFLTSFFSYFYQCLALFEQGLRFLNIHSDVLAILAMCIATLCSVYLFFKTEDKGKVLRSLFYTVLVWLPWLIYLVFRWDSNYTYSSRKLFLMVFAQFGSVLVVCFAYHYDREKFTKYFYGCTMGLLTILLIYFFFNHLDYVVVHKVNTSDIGARYSIIGTNSILLARSFAIGGLCIMVWGSFPYWIRIALCVPFVIGIYMTGSRGPAISFMIMFACHALWYQGIHKNTVIRVFVGSLLLAGVAAAVFTYQKDALEKYLTRGRQHETVLKASGRYDAFIASWKSFAANPIFGVGLGKFGNPRRAKNNQQDANLIIKAALSYPHNILCEVLAELGLVGALLFIILLRPGGWMLNLSNKFVYLFMLCFLFSMTSGDFYGNASVFIFYYIARFNRTTSQVESAY